MLLRQKPSGLRKQPPSKANLDLEKTRAALSPGDLKPMDADHDGSKLAQYSFSDLYLTLNGSEKPRLRRLHLKGSTGRIVNGIQPAPPALEQDLSAIAEQIMSDCFRNGQIQRELQIIHDGAVYRGALIAEPDFNVREKDDDMLGATRWCLRRFEQDLPVLNDLNLPNHIASSLRSSFQSRGLILISGSFGSGKTTTATATILNWINTSSEVAVTLEDPPEYALPTDVGNGRIYQIDITNQDPAEAVKHVRRMAPRYVFLGEIRSPEAARELIHLAVSGPLVICTIHASDPMQAISSLALFSGNSIGQDLSRQLISKSLSLVVHQEMRNGKIHADVFHIGNEDFAIQQKLREGRFDLLHEHMDEQRRRRENKEMNS
jgi:twitching motility protein PilT